MRSRFGGFNRRNLLFRSTSSSIIADSIWNIFKSSSSSLTQAPETIEDFSYAEAQGIWNLKSTTQFPKDQTPVNLEAGLTLTRTYQSTSSIANETAYSATSGSLIFACDVTFPSSVIDCQLFEIGGAGRGTWLGIRDNGTYLRLRAGSGGTAINGGAGSINGTACLDITDFPTDGLAHNLIWELNNNNDTIRLWIDGVLKGTATPLDGVFTNNQVSGGGSGAYLIGSTNIPGEPTTDWYGAEAGTGLRVYENQIIGA
jgi:hypothetical protein